jgi:ubiquinol-cytochrome c reductase cytochrome b subunit
MSTPEHIVPEWYFLFAYAILRSIPNKLAGVLALFASLLVLLTLPLISTSAIRSSLYRPLYQVFYWLLVADFILLSYIGQAAPESPFIEIGQIASVYYFAFFLVIIPALGIIEKNLIKA